MHRIWVKILASDMDNVERDDLDAHYSLEDVPYVQFFDNAVALHGTYWHRDFGHVKSHGCVNLAPLDARWLFDFTGPRVCPPAGRRPTRCRLTPGRPSVCDELETGAIRVTIRSLSFRRESDMGATRQR